MTNHLDASPCPLGQGLVRVYAWAMPDESPRSIADELREMGVVGSDDFVCVADDIPPWDRAPATPATD